MAITIEEREYFLEGINRVFRKTTNVNLAKIFVKDGSDTASIIKNLNDITDYVSDFVAAASAKGVVTSISIMDISEVDIANVQKYVGFDYNDVDRYKEFKDAIDEINKFIGKGDLSKFEDPMITSCLNELYKSISEIFQILEDVPPSDNGLHKISGESKTLTRCIYSRATKEYSLGEVITIFNPTFSGIEKSTSECFSWSRSKVPHYFTTGGVEDCSERGYIKEELALTECISALGHIE